MKMTGEGRGLIDLPDGIESARAAGYAAAVERDGFAVVEGVLDADAVGRLVAEIESIEPGGAISRRAGRAYGVRNLLSVLPSARRLADGVELRSLVAPVLGEGARAVRGIFFDKHGGANWKVAWHQDLTVAVRERAAVEGFGPWTVKAGVPHVQPPASVLEGVLALRLHLDDADESNGALRVVPGSHKHGRLGPHAAQRLKERHGVVTCAVVRGGAMLMRPLLLHASSAAAEPSHRRVLHFEYASSDLPGGLRWYDG